MGVFYWRSEERGLVRAFTSREGGHSRRQFTSLNLGQHVGDDPPHVDRNRRQLADQLSLEPSAVVFMDQVHGCEVAVLDRVPDRPPRVVAMVTTRPDVALAVLVADCVPVLLASADGSVIGVAHAGRRGMVGGVVGATVDAMKAIGASPISAVVGPSVCGRCYEVPTGMHDEAVAAEPRCSAVSWSGTTALDIAAGVVAQLRRRGVSLDWIRGCTREDPRLFSHRRDGVTGRSAGVIRRSQ